MISIRFFYFLVFVLVPLNGLYTPSSQLISITAFSHSSYRLHMCKGSSTTLSSDKPLEQTYKDISISIRGNQIDETLPQYLASSWPLWVYEMKSGVLEAVENPLYDTDDDWVNPTTFGNMFKPKDHPIPKVQPALGIAVTNGVARYIMPSAIFTLETKVPRKFWRNRGFASIPRATAWIDLFGINTPSVSSLKLTSFVADSKVDDKKIDDHKKWYHLDNASLDYEPHEALEQFQSKLSEGRLNELQEGYHYIDIPLSTERLAMNQSNKYASFLSDFDDTYRFLDELNKDILASEAVGELIIAVEEVSAGAESDFLPAVYKKLYEPGNVL